MTNQVCHCTLVVYRGHDYVLISKYNWHITVLKCHLSLIRFPDLKFLDAFQYLCIMNPARRNRWFLLLGTPIGRDL